MPPLLEVLGNCELLERILLHLPLRSLLIAQRISNACYDVIPRSRDIHRVSFWRTHATPIWSSRELIPPNWGEYYKCQYWDRQRTPISRPFINPFMDSIPESDAFDDDELLTSDGSEGLPGALMSLPAKSSVSMSRDAMVLTHPPISVLGIAIDFERDEEQVQPTLGSKTGPVLKYSTLVAYCSSFWHGRDTPGHQNAVGGGALSQWALYGDEA